MTTFECDVCSRQSENDDDRKLRYGATYLEPDGTYTSVCHECLHCFSNLSVDDRLATFTHPRCGDDITKIQKQFDAASWLNHSSFWDDQQRFAMRCIAARISIVCADGAALVDRVADGVDVEFGKGKMAFFVSQRSQGLIGRSDLTRRFQVSASLNTDGEATIDSFTCSPVQNPRMVCGRCGTIESAARQYPMCGHCRIVYYCGVACQREDWKRHKAVCKQDK